MSDELERIRSALEKLREAVAVVCTTDVESMYRELRYRIQEMMKDIDVHGVLEVPLYKSKVMEVKAVFDFRGEYKKFDVVVEPDDWVLPSLMFRGLSPTWSVPFLKVYMLVKNADKVVKAIEEEVEKACEDISKVVSLVQELSTAEVQAKVLAKALRKGVKDRR